VIAAPNALEFCGDIVYTTLHAVWAAPVATRATAAARIIPNVRMIRFFTVDSFCLTLKAPDVRIIPGLGNLHAIGRYR
jgi:hypothetical protein